MFVSFKINSQKLSFFRRFNITNKNKPLIKIIVFVEQGVFQTFTLHKNKKGLRDTHITFMVSAFTYHKANA